MIQQEFFTFTFSNNLYVVGGQSGIITTSTDSIVWTQRTSGFGTTQILSLTYGNNVFVAGGDSGTLTTSLDYAYQISPKGYLASGTTGKIDTSTDTISWSSRTSGITETFNEIISADPYESVIDAGSVWTLRTSLVTIASSNFMSYENEFL